MRSHRSTIVQIDRVRELLPDFHAAFGVVLRDGTRLTPSRRFRANVERAPGRSLLTPSTHASGVNIYERPAFARSEADALRRGLASAAGCDGGGSGGGPQHPL